MPDMTKAGILKSISETYKLAFWQLDSFPEEGPLSFDHLSDMVTKTNDESFSIGKLNRWLGWMQCAVVSVGIASLEDIKEMNRRNKDIPDG